MEPEELHPKGGDGPSQRVPFTFDQLVTMMRQHGVVRDDVPDANIRITVVTPWGVEELTSPDFVAEPQEWTEDDTLPHTQFDDPPYGKTEDEWRTRLIGAARAAGSAAELADALVHSLGHDLVESHDVPRDLMVKACTAFADRLWAEYHHAT